MPTPDTSNANVARVRRAAEAYAHAICLTRDGKGLAGEIEHYSTLLDRALADALEQQAAVSDLDAEDANWGRHPNAATILESDPFPDATPWKDRVAHGVLVVYGTSPAQVDAILRAAFPELAPND